MIGGDAMRSGPEAELAIDEPVHCDRIRIGQLLSNLLGNAVTHGAADKPVVVHAKTRNDSFELWGGNAGEAIPATSMDKLCDPFFRGKARASKQGLGLGLYIASQIAKAHGGTLAVASTPAETRFTFSMPLANSDHVPLAARQECGWEGPS